MKETPDDELSPEQKLERAEQRKLTGNEFCESWDICRFRCVRPLRRYERRVASAQLRNTCGPND